jgi:hypothetical protein
VDLTLTTETFNQDDQSWLGSAHGTSSGRPVTLDASKGFVAGTHYPNGYLPSGTPLGKVTAGGKYGLYDDAASDGRQTLVGHLLSPVKVSSGTATPSGSLYEHGRVVAANLPFAVDAAGKADVVGRIWYV